MTKFTALDAHTQTVPLSVYSNLKEPICFAYLLADLKLP